MRLGINTEDDGFDTKNDDTKKDIMPSNQRNSAKPEHQLHHHQRKEKSSNQDLSIVM